jgi:hypothetical protein
VDDFDAEGTVSIREKLREPSVRLDEDEPAALSGEVFGESAEARADFDDAILGSDPEL